MVQNDTFEYVTCWKFSQCTKLVPNVYVNSLLFYCQAGSISCKLTRVECFGPGTLILHPTMNQGGKLSHGFPHTFRNNSLEQALLGSLRCAIQPDAPRRVQYPKS